MHPVIALPLLGLTLRSYDVLMIAGIVTGLVLAPWLGGKLDGTDWRRCVPATVVLAVLMLLGARLHFVATQWGRFAAHPLSAFTLNTGGLHAPGAVIAFVLAAPFVLRAFALPLARSADVAALTAGVVLAIIRLGCFLNGCCFGTVCAWPWGVSFPRQSYVFLLHADQHLVDGTATGSAPVHPLQLYFLAASLGTAAVGLWVERHRRYAGEVALVGLVLFSGTSALLESFRGDFADRVYWGPLPHLAWVTLGMTALSAIALVVAEIRHRRRVPVAAPEGISMPVATHRRPGRLAGRLLLLCGVILAAALPGWAARPITYATTVKDDQGRPRDVRFEGSATRGRVLGMLYVDKFTLSVRGLIATDGSFVGTVYRADGTQAATFSARPGQNKMLEGTVSYRGRAREWRAPIILPSATAE
jgi:phosphatidylglycerol---prolipoprotein diacylglyceryl transferase